MIRAEKPVIVGDCVTLRPLSVNDASAMFASLEDCEAMRLTGTQSSHSYADIVSHLERCETADDRLDFAILVADDLIGEVVLNNIDGLNKSATFRIAIWYGKNRNNGYGTEATKLVIKHGFEKVGLNRIELEVFSFNPRARHVYKQTGFVHEGTRRQALCWDNQWVDAHMMAILHTDFDAA
ncbi:MAG: GNAT family protein [Pseudomonadota bacterium]